MSDDQVQRLIALIEGFQVELAAIRGELAETRRLVNLSAANAELIYDAFRKRGEAFDSLQRTVEQLDVRCPLVREWHTKRKGG